ncbi:MAG: Lrp/AsnC family transcriptional regulator [Dehalococcoidales bacterium]|nr:Lrp/AsnC family transcriptional regulator [Dehalococcoidales bacterium]
MPNMVKIDSLDERLIKMLQKDAHRSSGVLAKQLKVSPATVRRRMRRLIQNGTMRIAAIVDPAKIGLPLAAMIALHVEHDKLDSVVKQLSKRPEVGWLSTTTGRFDIMALARFPSTEELSKFIQKETTGIQGIRDSETFVCLNVNNDLPKPAADRPRPKTLMKMKRNTTRSVRG